MTRSTSATDPESTSTPTRRVLLLLAAVAVILGALAIRHCVGLKAQYVDPMVTVERAPLDERAEAKVMPPQALPDFPDTGEVYRTADRLRIASALALAAVIYASNELANGRHPNDSTAVVAAIQTAGLLPPGITITGPAMLLSPSGNLSFHFRPDPLTIEVVNLPLHREDGPALMVRIPGTGTNPDTGSVFIADRLGNIAPPLPFASVSDCVRAGWIDQPMNQADIPTDEQQQLRAWLSAKRHQ